MSDMDHQKDLISEETDELTETPIAEDREDKKSAPYSYRWDYEKQIEADAATQKKKRRGGILTFALVMSLTFLVCIGIMVGLMFFSNDTNTTTAVTSTQSVAMRLNPQTVLISTDLYEGTGFFIREDGYIATNYHTLVNASVIAVTTYSGTRHNATLIGYSEADDLAVLKITGRNYPVVTVGDSDAVSIGTTAIAVGNPGGSDYPWSTTKGIVSALDRTLVVSGDVEIYEVSMIQVDMHVNRGNSGGPLCNSRGEVIGIVNRRSTDFDNIGFALPINGAMEILNAIIEKGNANHVISKISKSRPIIGISGQTVEAGDLYYVGNETKTAARDGVLIVSVETVSPAAGKIKTEDIIVSFKGAAVNSMNDLTAILYGCHPGETVEFEVWRNGETARNTLTFFTK